MWCTRTQHLICPLPFLHIEAFSRNDNTNILYWDCSPACTAEMHFVRHSCNTVVFHKSLQFCFAINQVQICMFCSQPGFDLWMYINQILFKAALASLLFFYPSNYCQIKELFFSRAFQPILVCLACSFTIFSKKLWKTLPAQCQTSDRHSSWLAGEPSGVGYLVAKELDLFIFLN